MIDNRCDRVTTRDLGFSPDARRPRLVPPSGHENPTQRHLLWTTLTSLGLGASIAPATAAPPMLTQMPDGAIVVAMNVFGTAFGYRLHLTPPDPIRTLALDINTSRRPDLAHQVTMSHNEGAGITPCVRVLHEIIDGQMYETVDILDPEDDPEEFRRIFRALISPSMLYRFIWEVVDPPLFSNTSFLFEALDHDEVRLGGHILPGARPCLAFFRGSLGAIRGAPAPLGLPKAEVVVEELTGTSLVARVRVRHSGFPGGPRATSDMADMRNAAAQVLAAYDEGVPAVAASPLDPWSDIAALGRDVGEGLDLTSLAVSLLAGLGKLGWDSAKVIFSGPEPDAPEHTFQRGAAGPEAHVPLTSRGRSVARLEVRGDGVAALLDGLAPWIGIAVDNALTLASLGRAAPPVVGPNLPAVQRALGLTRRQAQVFEHLVRGLANKESAQALDCAENTVELHLTQVLKKAGVHGRVELLARYFTGVLGG